MVPNIMKQLRHNDINSVNQNGKIKVNDTEVAVELFLGGGLQISADGHGYVRRYLGPCMPMVQSA